MTMVHVTGDAARILTYLARESWVVPPPDEVVSVGERTPREYLVSRRIRWIVASVLAAVIVACLGMLAADAAGSSSEAQLAASWFGIFLATLVLMTLAWRVYRAAALLELGPLDAPSRSLRAEAAALIVEGPEGGARRLELGALTRCEVVGHATRHGWRLVSLTLDDGAGPIELRAAWLRSERILVALADRLVRSGVVASTGP